MAISNTKAFPKHLDGDINKIFFNEYRQAPSEYDKVATVVGDFPGGHIIEAELSPIGALQTKPEGSRINFDDLVEGNEVSRTPTTYALGFQLTKEMVEDDLFGNFRKAPKELGKSAALKRETVFWDLFNSGFATHTAWDGEYIFDASGRVTLKTNAAQNNRPSPDASLSETSLQAAFEYFDNLVDGAGRPIVVDSFTLIHPVALQWTANILHKTGAKPGSMNNDINTVKDRGGWVTFKSRYLTSDTAWFLMAKGNDMRFVWKRPATMESQDDFYTDNALWKVTERFACFCNNPIYGYGTSG